VQTNTGESEYVYVYMYVYGCMYGCTMYGMQAKYVCTYVGVNTTYLMITSDTLTYCCC